MHLAITDRISKAYPCKDQNRLAFGAILPDAAVEGNSHLRISVDEDTKKTYDLTAFRSRFAVRMLADDLYLGYYLHLVQDLFFRKFVYDRYHWDPSPPGNIERLHNDYALLNPYIVQKYALTNSVTVPAGFDEEPLNDLGRFSPHAFVAGMAADFQSGRTGTAFFFTKEMADEYIAYAGEKCEQELCALRRGMPCLDERALAWEKR